ncbi:MAG: hypothetical protein GQ529_13300 [Methyloprofundus sp.]|nr:hypothetical protein [Methyloprofundus sp.]
MTQEFCFTVVLEIQAHSRLRNCFSGAAGESKDKSDSGIIEFSFLRNDFTFSRCSVPSHITRSILLWVPTQSAGTRKIMRVSL